MAEQSVDYKKMSDYLGLEILLNLHLNQLEYKSDLIILFAHYMLTKVLGYDCVEMRNNPSIDDTIDIIEVLPSNWNRLPGGYKLIYKKDDIVKIVTGQKQNESFVLYLLKENYDRDQVSPVIQLKSYIPDDFFDFNSVQHRDIRSIVNLCEIMDILNATILGNEKLKFKPLLDNITADHKEHCQKILRDDFEVTSPNPLSESDECPSDLLPPPRCPKGEECRIGKICLQDTNKHKPHDVNRDMALHAYNHPDFYIQEDLDGEPTSSLYS